MENIDVMFGSRKIEGKIREKENIEEKWKKQKNKKNKKRFKVNKLFLYTSSNSFHLFLLIV